MDYTNRCSSTIRCRHIAWSIKWAKVFMRRLAVSRCKFMLKVFRTNTIYSHCKIAVCNGRISCFNTPEWFTQRTNLNVSRNAFRKFQKSNFNNHYSKHSPLLMDWTRFPLHSVQTSSSFGDDDVHSKYWWQFYQIRCQILGDLCCLRHSRLIHWNHPLLEYGFYDAFLDICPNLKSQQLYSIKYHRALSHAPKSAK